MLLLFSPDISVRKKVFYYGLILIVISGVLFSNMLHVDSEYDVILWAVAGLIGGFTVMLLAIVYPTFEKDYKGINRYFFKLILLSIPLVIIVFIYLLCVLLECSEIVDRFLIYNNRVVPISWLLILVSSYFLKEKNLP